MFLDDLTEWQYAQYLNGTLNTLDPEYLDCYSLDDLLLDQSFDLSV